MQRVKLFEPGDRFVAVSITGYSCQLLCEYCRGRWLRGMIPAPTPHALEKLVKKKADKLTGILVSGGFTREGTLPFEPFIETIARLKRRYKHLIVSMHTGFLDHRRASILQGIVDVVDYEIPLTSAHLHQMHIKWRTPHDYIHNAAMLIDMGFNVAPHFLLGLPGATTWEELGMLHEATRALRVEVAVILYYTDAPPSREAMHAVRLAAQAARRAAREVSLGCMRPRWMKMLEPLILHAFDRLAVPSRETRRLLGSRPLPYCCSIPSGLLKAPKDAR